MADTEKTSANDPVFDEPATGLAENKNFVPDYPTGDEPAAGESKSGGGFLSSPWYFLIIGLLIGGLAGFYMYPLVSGQPEAEAKQAAPLAAVESSAEMNEGEPHQQIMMAVIANARHFQGDPNAPVTVVEFGDFNCGYCGKWAKETLPLIDENYVQEGKVRIAYVHYPILGADSMTAAEASECAARLDEGSFWEYHNLLYENQGMGFTKANLTNLAGDMGLDTAEFEACMDDFPDRATLEDDIRLAQVMGVRGTPAFLVNGIPLAGAYPYEDFQHVIDGVLAGEF